MVEKEWEKTVAQEYKMHVEESAYFSRPVLPKAPPAAVPQLRLPTHSGERPASCIVDQMALDNPVFLLDNGKYYNSRGIDVSRDMALRFRTAPEML